MGICQFALLGSRPVPWHASPVPLPECKKLLKEGEIVVYKNSLGLWLTNFLWGNSRTESITLIGLKIV